MIGANAASLTPVNLGDTAGGFSEAWLQNLIHNHPSILPIGEIEPGFGDLVAIAKEVGTKHGPIDNLMLTAEGNIVLVEVKLWRNPEARRKVVAQALDYASCLFEMSYEALEKAILAADFGSHTKPLRLYDLIADLNGAPDEAAFIDAVSTNLRRGRILILVVGDGIRTETERLASLLQSHAGAHFTFALIELALYRLGAETLVLPRTLAQTQMISRGIIQIEDHRVRVITAEEAKRSPASASSTSRPAASITEEQFYDRMTAIRPDIPDRLRALIHQLEPLGVYPDFQGSLILRWDPPEGRSINLGYVAKNGQVWTDAINSTSVPQELAHEYNDALASALGIDVNRNSNGGRRYIQNNGHAPRVTEIADRLEQWPAVIEHFMQRMRERFAG